MLPLHQTAYVHRLVNMSYVPVLLPVIFSCYGDRFQVVLCDGQSAEDGKKIADDLMAKLEIDSSDLLCGAYMDLLLANDTNNSEQDS